MTWHEYISQYDSFNNKFHKLISNLSQILGPSSGLNSEDVNILDLRDLMTAYACSDEDWSKYAFSDYTRGYTRNLVDRGNGKSNLLVLVGGPGKGSPVHDHADANCLMKVLKGRLLETRYDFPTDLRTPLKVIKKTPFGVNQVTHMADELVSHRISDPDEKNAAVSLHLYTPPNATKFGCRIYDERTGKSSHVTQSNFFSTFGKRAVE